MFTASKEKYLLVDEQNNIIGIPENLLHLLIPFVQNLASTFSIWSEFSAETCFVCMLPEKSVLWFVLKKISIFGQKMADFDKILAI